MRSPQLKIVDLDGTLWKVDARPWIVWKDAPGDPILRLDATERVQVESNSLSTDFVLEHCGRSFSLTEDLVKKLQVKSGRKPVAEKMGVSYAEWFMPEFLNKQAEELILHEHVIKDLSKRPGDLVILTARCNKNKHFPLICELENELTRKGLKVKEYHFVGNSNAYSDKESNAAKKAITILQYLIGLQVDRVNKKFIDQEADSYLIVDFFDDEPINLANAENIQSYLNFYFFNSDQSVRQKVLDRIAATKLVLHVNRATGNSLKPYDSLKVELKYPEKKFLF